MINNARTSQERIILFSRFPEPGRTKTRLIPLLGKEKAAALQRAMTEHIIAAVEHLAKSRSATVEIRYTGGDDRQMKAWLGTTFEYIPQGDGHLGQKMQRAIDAALEKDSTRILVVGADCPSLTTAIMVEALDALDQSDLVLGPATDGGYYCIGMSRNLPDIFSNIEWGTERVLARTMDIARSNGLSIHMLPTLNDIDRPEDLADPALMSLLHNEHRSEIERKIIWARMSCEIARKRSRATVRTILLRKTRYRRFLADRSRCSLCKRLL